MKLSKVVDKVKKYLKKDILKNSHEEKISEILENLQLRKEKIKLEISELKDYDLKKSIELEKKLKAINILIKKSESLISKSSKKSETLS
ncbi:hypothetical protein [Aliarcobacter skirrowii]|jgi:hypothetical protein|uniref:Uncharacterized protein n=1 Tax=Aliarcobacter skirrowii CCUG 10374 TaxID=1032239 RepID=A0AAD0SLX0_9BACT|nr:hypothetical protein [Aliarcobacter skirrowii]AXX85073.1 hypothetical protein ASKIR_1269 [Aliarcobacter skirrowii CCUG 10374]KAB0620766.1 hypothetical protein F7P70_06410 [Aliarcobacter skirrowii CCUG 10374]MDX4071479.1 hypothetical protein [Aliarcobacter skirrowii]RXI25889.1 hypothetical protein CP959_06200 [Aliarcobacter skirrowii CCUG 10374]SUU96402.1 Uncharacterised protein [Aliarcobacter skirrowii]